MKVISLNTCVVGSGAAGFNAAVRLRQFGVESVAMVTEGINTGTSRNTGSDKQTYYKLGLAGEVRDSVAAMAEDLFAGGCVDGDNALVEAALSARSFLHLCEIGVPFPTNRYGEFVGYKTDHDPCARATSVGPLTSKEMTEKLQAEAQRLGVAIYDHQLVISLITDGKKAVGLLTLDTQTDDLTLYNCRNIVYATGGPGGIYQDSVYPACHNGASGILFEAGVMGQNLTEWQYGLASVAPRWNVSGTYMQVLPRFVSVDEAGNEYEFLAEYFSDLGECLSMVFLKGYQWPFDSRKVLNGSSVIDLLVYRESVLRGRKVYLDYRSNPFGQREVDYGFLSEEARAYLEKAGACFGTPIQRLAHMNQPAIDLYAGKGVDLHTEMLQIALCAQHNNGGIAVDAWWRSSMKGLFVCGEAAGTHGIYRPGGSALNAGQVGSLRAAQYIAAKGQGEPLDEAGFLKLAESAVRKHTALCENWKKNPAGTKTLAHKPRARMSAAGGAIRRGQQIREAIRETKADLEVLESSIGADRTLAKAYRLRDVLLCQRVYLEAMLDYAEQGFTTRGSALYYTENGQLRPGLEECFRFLPTDGAQDGMIQQIRYWDGECQVSYRPVRPMPEGGGFFENVWRGYRENQNIED